MAALTDFDITITADSLKAEAVKGRPYRSAPALNLCFDDKWFPVSIVLRNATDVQVQQIADAINAIMDGDTVTITKKED